MFTTRYLCSMYVACREKEKELGKLRTCVKGQLPFLRIAIENLIYLYVSYSWHFFIKKKL